MMTSRNQLLLCVSLNGLLLSFLCSAAEQLNQAYESRSDARKNSSNTSTDRSNNDVLVQTRKKAQEAKQVAIKALSAQIDKVLEGAEKLDELVEKADASQKASKSFYEQPKKQKYFSKSTANGLIIATHFVTRHISERWKNTYRVGGVTVFSGPILQAMGLAGTVAIAKNRENLGTQKATKKIGREIASAGLGAIAATAFNEAIEWPEHHHPWRAALVWVVKRVTEGLVQNSVHIATRSALKGKWPAWKDFGKLSISLSTDEGIKVNPAAS